MSEDVSTPTYAQSPFNNPAGDIVLRASDGVNFRVRSAILAEASPIFSDMLSLPQGTEASDSAENSSTLEGKPVVDLTEDSGTLDPLLRLCYPTQDPQLTDIRDIRLVLGAALKYDMDEAVALMKDKLRSFIANEPFRTWSSACLLRLEDVAKESAVALLDKDIPSEAPPELNEVSAGDYFRLETFHRAGGNVPETYKLCEPNASDAEHTTTRTKKRNPGGTVTYQTRPYADIILRSTDGHEFPTHRIILTLASPVLSAQIARHHANPVATTSATNTSAPHTPGGAPTLPVLNIGADGATLGPLLELCYARARSPVTHISSLDLPLTFGMATLARRCAMDGPLEMLRFQAFYHAYKARPLAAYLTAARAGFTDWATDALSSLRGDLFAHGYVPEMETAPAIVYHRLMLNRRRSVVATARLTGTATPTPPGSPARAASVPPSPSGSQAAMVQKVSEGDPWLVGMWTSVAEGLWRYSVDPDSEDGRRGIYRIDPNLKRILNESLTRKIWCPKCEQNARLIMGMRDMYDNVFAVAYQHDVSGIPEA